MKTVILCIVFLLVGLQPFASAEDGMWVLDPQEGWRDISDMPEGRYMMAISELNQQLATGKRADVVAALESLKADYPDLAGGDLEAFIAAEKIYARGNLAKAGRLYRDFLSVWSDSPLQPAVLERYFSIGAAFLQGQKRVFLWVLRLPAFDEGVSIMRHITDTTGNSPIALRALQVTAENQERRKRFIDAYHTWAEIAVRWPTGAEGRNALLRMGRALHASYEGPDYDVSALYGAASYFEDFLQRYPHIAEDINLAETLMQISEQLAYKHYQVGFYYERSGNRDTAHQHYRTILDQWPDTTAARMATERLGPDAKPAVKPTVSRKMFNVTTGFLDNWFGFALLFGASETQSDETN